MGNDNVNSKYNQQGNVDIILSLDRVCYFPGENMNGNIKLIPKAGLYKECKNFSQLIIKITQHSHYIYQVGSDYEVDEEIIELMKHNYKFSDFISVDDDEAQMNLPFNYDLPTYTRPSIFINNDDYVKHFITIEYPHFNTKRTLMFIVKNHLYYNSRNRTFISPFCYPTTFNKKRFFKKKGSCQLVINMPRNFFLYNEKVGYNIHLDCRILEIPVYKIKVTFCRTRMKNYSSNITQARSIITDNLLFKEYKLNKFQKLFNIIDYIMFSDPIVQRDGIISPSDLYQEMDAHGLYELSDSKYLKKLYPSCSEGLLVINYSLKVKVYFDSILTSDESVFAPIDFCDIIDCNLPNVNKPITNNNMNLMNSIPNVSNSQINTFHNQNINNTINSINDNNHPSITQSSSIDGKKNYLEDNEDINLDDWVIIDKPKK